MIKLFDTRYFLPTKDFRALSVLSTINKKSAISQKAIGEMANLSSSMVNNYIKLFRKDGLLTVSGKTNRTTEYHLTGKGVTTLSESLMNYSAEIVRLYATVKYELTTILKGFYSEGIRTVVLFGASETAEVVYAALKNTDLVPIGIVDSDPKKQGELFNGLMVRSPDEITIIKPDSVIITSFARQEEIYEHLFELTDSNIKIKKLAVF